MRYDIDAIDDTIASGGAGFLIGAGTLYADDLEVTGVDR
jgi:hypothetical protein